MRIDILTLFPEMFAGPFGVGLFKRALDRGLVTVNLRNIRDFTHDRHHTVDDAPYGGGAGMLLKPEPLFEAVDAIRAELPTHGEGGDTPALPVILLSPQGRLFNQRIALELSLQPHLVLVCGRYEGVDERVGQHLATDELSIGDYVLGGGELPAMVVVEAVVRLLPGFLGSGESSLVDSHAHGLLEYPQYTRPAEYRGWEVPEVLLSGDHARIAKWRREQVLLRTWERRPDLLERASLSAEERELVARLKDAVK